MNHFVLNTCNINYWKKRTSVVEFLFFTGFGNEFLILFLWIFFTNFQLISFSIYLLVHTMVHTAYVLYLVAVFFKTIWLVRIFMKVCKNWFEICCWTAYLMYSITEVIDCSVRRGIFTMNFSIAITMLLCAKVLICAHQVNGSKYLLTYLLT